MDKERERFKGKRGMLDGRLKSQDYIEDLEENLEENLEEEPGQNIRLEKKEVERKVLEEIEKIAKDRKEGNKAIQRKEVYER